MGEVREGRQATEKPKLLAEIQASDTQRQAQAPGEMWRRLLYAPRGNTGQARSSGISHLLIPGKGKRSMCFVMPWDGGSI